MTLSQRSPIGRRCVWRHVQLLSIQAADLNVRSDKGGDGNEGWTERWRGGANHAVFTHPCRSPRGHVYEPLRNKTPDRGPSLSITAKQKNLQKHISQSVNMLAVTTSEILKRSAALWLSGLTCRRYSGMLQFSRVCISLFLTVGSDDWRFLTYAYAIYFVLVSEPTERGRLTCRFERHQPEFRENVNHTSLLIGNLSPRHFSAVGLAVYVNSQIRWHYTQRVFMQA